MAKHKKKIKQTAKDKFLAEFKKAKRPDDFKSDSGFLKFATGLFDKDLTFDNQNRIDGLEDAEFASGNQWDDFIKTKREAAKKPTLTFNRLVAFVGQVVGGRRLNETVIRIKADDNKFKPQATVIQGLIRSIQKVSKADIAYNKAQENQVISGIGNFEIRLDYAYDDVFEQDAGVHSINNPFAVVWDRFSTVPDGADAGHVFKVRTLSHEDFEAEWPGKSAADLATGISELGYKVSQGWITDDKIRVVDFWRVRSRIRILALLRDPEDNSEDVIDVTDKDPDEWIKKVVANDAGRPIMREVDVKYAEMYTISASDILEGPYELPIKRVPIFRVPGWEFNVGDKVVRFGVIRFLKDPQRLHNYWRSTIAEKLTLSPRGNWIASAEAVEGREKEWRDSHTSDDPLLIYDGGAGQAPTRVPPTQIEAGLIEQAGMASQDLRDISNIHEANLGSRSNEVSGVAIRERRNIGDTGTSIYSDNLEMAIESCGGVLHDLVPFTYSTARTVNLLGEEGEELDPQVINDATNKDSIDITAGKYKVSSTTGPSTSTKRDEAQEGMLNMVNAMPDTLTVVADKIIEAQDWPGSGVIAQRLRDNMDPALLDERDLTDKQRTRLQQQQQQAQLVAQREQQLFDAELREKNAKADQAESLAQQARANARKADAGIELEEFKAVADVEDKTAAQVMKATEVFDKITTPTNPQKTGE